MSTTTEPTLNAYKRIDQATDTGQGFAEVSEEEFWDALEILPPIYFGDTLSQFAMSEPKAHDSENRPVFYCFFKSGGKHYGLTSNLAEAAEKVREFRLWLEKLKFFGWRADILNREDFDAFIDEIHERGLQLGITDQDEQRYRNWKDACSKELPF